MISIESYVRRGRHTVRRWALDPRIHTAGRAAAHLAAGFLFSAASLGNMAMPLSMAVVCVLSGRAAVLAAVGGCVGYLAFWGHTQYQALLWLVLALAVSLIVTQRYITQQMPLLLASLAGLIVAASGLAFQMLSLDEVSIGIYLLRVGLGAASTWLFALVRKGRNALSDWTAGALAVLALAQIMPIPYVGLGYIAAAMMAVAESFPAAALSGLALDLAQITRVPMSAVMVLSYWLGVLPWNKRLLRQLAPAAVYIFMMTISGHWDLYPLPGLVIGGLIGTYFPKKSKAVHRRGETGTAQVRLEMAASVLAQTEQLLLEASVAPIDEEALVARAAERACNNCPCRKNCKDSRRLARLPGLILHKSLLASDELPIICRKSGRFLAELHRAQEQLRAIRADRERQREYRAAVVQQYQFLSEYLQELSDRLSKRQDDGSICYTPKVRVFGNRPEEDNGDRCLRFAGTMGKYYVLLCDGMGTGLGAVQEAKTAADIVRRLLMAGYPASHALKSLNSLCALRERAGAVTVDLAELDLTGGKVTLYKWGAAPSYLVSQMGAEKIGTASPPPGLSITDYHEMIYHISLRRAQTLYLVSDGVGEDEALRCCLDSVGLSPAEVASRLLVCAGHSGQDDATVIAISLTSEKE